ncbi:MAG: hypothetical protein NWQ24_03785 [Haliea sp.]|jgi:vacuolar-type H+-ATPase subunit I/STV1|nr:hypothetical protein [Haliea sp.]MDP4789033.1 hypothetical protein [Haliea sp.]MDP5063775.1 hypothetical protein [Haliea sp.]
MSVKRAIVMQLIGAVLCISLGAVAVAHGDLYRYRNDQDVVVVDDRVPPQYVARGYEVLNERGVVIRVVPRVLTPEELADATLQMRVDQAAAREEQRLRKWDQTLLLRYSAIEDIEAHRDRALADLRLRVGILKSNRRSFKQQIETYQSQAADLERRGYDVDDARLKAMSSLQKELAATDRQIADREVEAEQVRADFSADIERFKMLEEAVRLRRELSSRSSREE